MPVLKRLVLLAVLLPLAACKTTTPISVTDTSCLAYEPVRYSRKDSEETRRQIIEHNAAVQIGGGDAVGTEDGERRSFGDGASDGAGLANWLAILVRC